MPIRPLLSLLLLLPMACAQQQVMPPEGAPPRGSADTEHARGILECPTDQPCRSEAAVADADAVAVADASLSARDVQVQLLRVDQGREPLANGSSLNQGDRFAIRIRALADAHVYLWHRAPDGWRTELIAASGALGGGDCRRSNWIRAGQVIELPAQGEHYRLTGSSGTERLQALVLPTPLCAGASAYRDPIRRIGVAPDCGAGDARCGEVLTIHHVKRI